MHSGRSLTVQGCEVSVILLVSADCYNVELQSAEVNEDSKGLGRS